jgi:hypothetical protein
MKWRFVIATNGIVASRHTTLEAARSAWDHHGWRTVYTAEILKIPDKMLEGPEVKVGQRIQRVNKETHARRRNAKI